MPSRETRACVVCGKPFPRYGSSKRCLRHRKVYAGKTDHRLTSDELEALLKPYTAPEFFTYTGAQARWGCTLRAAMERVNTLVHYGWVRVSGPGLFRVVNPEERG